MHTHTCNSQGKKREKGKRSALCLFLKVDSEGADVTLGGRLFQARAAATREKVFRRTLLSLRSLNLIQTLHGWCETHV